jgi:subtilisin family serine protease
MMLRLLATLLILATLDSIVLAQSQRVAYVPSASSDAEKLDQDPRLSKLSPELADMVRRNATYIGQQLNGSVVVEGRAADLAGLENLERPGNVSALAVNSEQLIMEYPPGEPPSEKSLNDAGFDLLDTNKEARFVIVAPVPVPENPAARAPGIQPVEFLALTEVPRALEISRNVVMTVPEDELKPVIVPAEDLQVAAASSSSELSRVRGIQQTGAGKVQDISDPSRIIVAVIDTGVEYDHSDLVKNMWVNKDEIPGNNLDDDNNGVIDDRYGASFVNGRTSGDPRDDNGHGTHCAGTIAGVANGEGVIGMAQTQVMALKFLTAGGGGLTSDAVRCIDYARNNGARIISNSWGGKGPIPKVLEQAIQRAQDAGILFVVAAGNDGKNIDFNKYSPANSENDNVLTVGSVTFQGGRSRFSNYGPRKNVDIGAPGGAGLKIKKEDIFSTWLKNDFAYLAGTSMATPHVSGAAALLLGTPKFRDATFFDLKQELLKNARKNPQLAQSWKDGLELDVSFLLEEPPVTKPGEPGKPEKPPVTTPGVKDFFFANAKEFGSSSTLITRRVVLRERATINLFASASAAGVADRQTFVTGISIGNSAHKPSFRVVTAGGKDEYVSFGTSLSTTLEAGTHNVSWWIRLPRNGRLKIRGGGSLDAQAFAISQK